MKGKNLRRWLAAALIPAGALGGWLWYRLVGCVTGTCPISSNPFISAAYGTVIGLLLWSAVRPGRGGKNSEGEDNENA